MIYLGSERTITQSFANHKVAEDYGGFHKSEVKINGSGKVIKVINKFISHQDSIDYNTFLKNEKNWYSNGIYNCISITGKKVKMTVEETGGNQVWIETYENNEKLIFRLCHLDSILVKVGDIVNINTIIGLQGNTGLVSSSKSVTDITYGTHVHFEVTKNNQYINPRKYANGEVVTNYLSNEINKNKNQIKILVQQINIREKADEKSKDIGDVFYNEYYDVLEIIDTTNYIWYKIKNNNGITGYVASLKNGKWVEYIENEGEIININTGNGINENKNQIKILVQQINIREKIDENSKDIGDVFYNEYYDVLEIIDTTNYIWYKIKTNNGITGYVASLKNGKWIEYKKALSAAKVTSFKLIFECEKTGQYSVKLNAGEKLYIENNE